MLDKQTCSECPVAHIKLADVPRGPMTVIDVGIHRIKLCPEHLRELKQRLSKRSDNGDAA